MEYIYKPENGIYGYAPAAPNGSRGADGNEMFYSPINLGESTNVNITKSLISHKKVLSFTPSIQNSETIEYSDGDMILTMDGSVYEMNNLSDGVRIDRVGSIKIPVLNNYEGVTLITGNKVVFTVLTEGPYDAPNDYNYVPGCMSPLYHHRDSIDSSVHGNYIQCSSDLYKNIPFFDGKYMKLVINFVSGMRFEKILDASTYKDPIFIDNRYFFNYGHANELYAPGYVLSSYDEEKSDATSANMQPFFYTYGKTDMLDGYVEYSFMDQTYRTKIEIIL